MSSSQKPADYPFVAEGGITVPASGQKDPFAALDDLMVVVEALCPVWPERSTFANAGKMLL